MKLPRCNELSYVVAVILCSLAVCLSANSGFGVSMVAAPAYILYLKLSTLFPFCTFGMVEYSFQGLLIILLSLFLRRFKWKYPLAFVTAVLYGLCLDFWRLIFGDSIYPLLWQRILACIAGLLICAFSIALFLRTYLPQQAYELVVKEITEKTHANMHKVKWIYDISSLLVAMLMMFVFFRQFSFSMIGIGTLLATVLNTPLIAFFGKWIDRSISFDPAFPKLHEVFMKHLN